MPRTMQLHASTTFSDLLQEVQRFWTPLPDKPEETPERLLCALWSTACGAPVSVDRAPQGSLPALDTDSLGRLRDLLEPFESPEFLGRCDFLSCNPPYISAAKVKEMHPEISQHEPEAAFNGGVYGVSILMKIVK